MKLLKNLLCWSALIALNRNGDRMSDKLIAKFKVGIKIAIPGTMLSIEAPEMIEMVVQGVTNLGGKKYRVEFKAINGIGHLIIEGADTEFARLLTLLTKEESSRKKN